MRFTHPCDAVALVMMGQMYVPPALSPMNYMRVTRSVSICMDTVVLFTLEFLIWENRPTCNHVFMDISSCVSIVVPDLQLHEAYPERLGSPVHSHPSLNYIHVVALVYDALSHVSLLPVTIQIFYHCVYLFSILCMTHLL
jgi:hypothetical protein